MSGASTLLDAGKRELVCVLGTRTAPAELESLQESAFGPATAGRPRRSVQAFQRKASERHEPHRIGRDARGHGRRRRALLDTSTARPGRHEYGAQPSPSPQSDEHRLRGRDAIVRVLFVERTTA